MNAQVEERQAPAGSAAALGHTIARVIVDSPLPQLDHLFDYRIPAALAAEVRAGVRVRVPLRVARRIADGFVVATSETSEAPGALSDLDSVVSPVPVLAPEVWRLARAVADRSAGTASDVLRLAVPKRQVRVERVWLESVGSTSSEADVSTTPAADPHPPVADQLPVVGQLVSGARIAAAPTPRLAEIAGATVGGWAVELATVAAAIVTSGRSVIVAVPDARDLDQVATALAAGPAAARVLRVDAGQPNPARYRSHLAALGPAPRILLGNRSALYAPAADLGAILVWDEADPLHREQLAPGAAIRDVALLRQEQSGAGLLFLAHARSSAVERLVEVGYVIAAPPPPAKVLPKIVLTPDDSPGARIPSAAWRDASRVLATGPVLVLVARPGDAALRALRSDGAAVPPIDAGRTAHELGRAFPGTPVVVADGEHPHDVIDAAPSIVIATRGAEPRVRGGYGAVLLLDGRRMLARESLWVAEDCLRWWMNAASFAAPGAPVHLVGVQGDVATALATWRSADFAARQLVDRRALRFPPVVRLAAITGTASAVEQLVDALRPLGADALVREDEGPGELRVAVRFDYGAGTAIAAAAKAALIKAASARRAGPGGVRVPARTLRVRFDVHEPV